VGHQNSTNKRLTWLDIVQRWMDRYQKYFVFISFLISGLAITADLTNVFQLLGITNSFGLVVTIQLIIIALMLAFFTGSSVVAGVLFLVLGGYISIRGYFFLYPQEISLAKIAGDFYANAGTELISIAITVLVIDVINKRRNKQQELADLKWQMGSKDNVLVLEAVRKLRGKKWLIDGTLRGIDLRGANLSNAKLFMANLEEANLEKVKLKGAFMKRANLRNANVTIEQLATVDNMEGAIMPDGRKYEEWGPIIPEKQPAQLSIEKSVAKNGEDSKLLLLLTGAGIAVFSSALSLWLRGKWVK